MGNINSDTAINDCKSLTYRCVGLGKGLGGSIHLHVVREGLSEKKLNIGKEHFRKR